MAFDSAPRHENRRDSRNAKELKARLKELKARLKEVFVYTNNPKVHLKPKSVSEFITENNMGKEEINEFVDSLANMNGYGEGASTIMNVYFYTEPTKILIEFMNKLNTGNVEIDIKVGSKITAR